MCRIKKIPKLHGKVYIKLYVSEKNKEGGNVSAIIAYYDTVTDPIKITEKLNIFFTSIGTNLQKKILPTKKNLTDY